MLLLSHSAKCNMANIFRFSHVLQLICNLIIARYEKRGKYLPILHETTCDNYFIVKCLTTSNVAGFILVLINYIEFE